MPTPSPSRRVALVLSGCGVHDGTEVHEAVLALLALDRAGTRVTFAAPNIALAHVVNHQTGEINGYDSRNVRVESARIARGAVADLASLRIADLDAAVFPGGYGAMKNLSDYAFKARAASVNPDVARFLKEMHAARKPMALICTAPMLAARVLGPSHPTLTLGHDAAVAADAEAFGARHEACDARAIVIDRDHRIVTTPAYMTATRIADAAEGIDRAVRAMLELI